VHLVPRYPESRCFGSAGLRTATGSRLLSYQIPLFTSTKSAKLLHAIRPSFPSRSHLFFYLYQLLFYVFVCITASPKVISCTLPWRSISILSNFLPCCRRFAVRKFAACYLCLFFHCALREKVWNVASYLSLINC
jgi:hypothetical protein